MPCETIFAADVFLIEDLEAVVTDVTPPGESPPTSVIRSDQDIEITVSWKTTGGGTGMIAGEWHLLVFAESLGPGPEVILVDPDDHIFDLEPGPAPEYSRVVNVSAGTLPVVGGHGVTLYKLTTSLTYFDASPGGRVRGEMACYVHGPIIQIYDVGPI